METLDLSTLFWLFTIGMLVGAAVKLAMGSKGIGLIPNVLCGAMGALIVGSIAITLQVFGSLVFALMASLAVVVLANVFNVQPEEAH